MRPIRLLVPLLALTAAGVAAAAGSVAVSFKPAHELSDVGRGLDRERNVRALTERFQALAPRLADGQTLKVEVLDVDMAGEMLPTRNGQELRVMRGGADWPRMHLRWTLSAEGRSLRSGEDRLSDMAYLSQPLRGRDDTPVAYEGRLIERWFAERVQGTAP